jgi:thioredoxin-dependent peroxiredoxin
MPIRFAYFAFEYLINQEMIKVGEKVPFIFGPDQHGEEVKTAELLHKKNIVIYFYPKDETGGCTAQACSFRDAYEEFLSLDCEVIGISGDSLQSHEKFASHHRLPYRLLSDGDRKIRKAFQVPRDFLGLLPGRYTYIVNKEGILLHVFHSATNMKAHIEQALEILKKQK